MGNFYSYTDNLDMEFWHEICAKSGKLYHYKKGEFFVQHGDVIRYMGIVKEGYFKYVVTDSKGNEHITGLALSGEFVGDYLSTTQKIPCMTSIVAATNVEVLVCDCEVLNKVFNEDRELHQRLSDLLFHDVYKQYLDMHRFSPKERYIALLKRCPDILQNITIGEVASYLNVTPTYLSRIRKEITFENKWFYQVNEFNTYLNNIDYSFIKDLCERKEKVQTYRKGDFFYPSEWEKTFCGMGGRY